MMMISDKMCKKLNEQLTNEFYASHLYLEMACAFDSLGLKVFSKRFFQQSQEERDHALKLAKYVLDVGGEVHLDGIWLVQAGPRIWPLSKALCPRRDRWKLGWTWASRATTHIWRT